MQRVLDRPTSAYLLGAASGPLISASSRLESPPPRSAGREKRAVLGPERLAECPRVGPARAIYVPILCPRFSLVAVNTHLWKSRLRRSERICHQRPLTDVPRGSIPAYRPARPLHPV